MKVLQNIKQLTGFTGNTDRSSIVKKNVIEMLAIKGGTILTNFLLVPVTLNYVDSDTYGIWLTLSSIVAWISFFDVGINNGLKNKLAESLADGDYELSQKYVSTAYALLCFIFIPIMVILLTLSLFLDWNAILNINYVSRTTLTASIQIIVSYFCLNFILSTINVVLQANQRTADSALRTFIQQFLSLVVIYIMTLCTKGSLVNLSIGLCLAPILVVLLFNITLFRGRYKRICPSLKCVEMSLAPSLLKLGVQFFIIQISAIIQYQLTNFIIIRYYGASDVTSYNVAYKYFGVIYMIWGVFLTPLWPAVTDAVAKGEYKWIEQALKKYMKYCMLFILFALLMLLASKYVYSVWVGQKVQVDFSLSLWVMIFYITFMFNGPFVAILNGASELKLQTIAGLFAPILYLIIVYLLIRLSCPVYSILIAMTFSNVYGLFIAPVQCVRYIKHHVK